MIRSMPLATEKGSPAGSCGMLGRQQRRHSSQFSPRSIIYFLRNTPIAEASLDSCILSQTLVRLHGRNAARRARGAAATHL